MKLAISRKGILMNGFWVLVFLYFLTLSADRLHVQVHLFKPKVNHLLAVVLCGTLMVSRRFIVVPKQFFMPFLLLFASIVISSFFSVCFSRSLGYSCVSIFMFLCYFLIPLNLMLNFDHHKLLKLYFISFVLIGLYATGQFVLSFFGIHDPTAHQRAAGTITRGQGFSYEASFYALYAIPFVIFYNTRKLFSPDSLMNFKNLLEFGAVNFLLISSTSTSVFFTYMFFLFLLFFFSRFRLIKCYFKGFSRRVLGIAIGLFSIFFMFALAFHQLFIDTFFKFFDLGFTTHWSFADRWKTIENAWSVFCEFPIFGIGLGSVGPYLYQKLNFYDGAPIFNPTLELVESLDPQNIFTEVLASLGVFGLIAILLFALEVVRLFWKVIQDRCLPNEQRIIIFALFISVILMIACLQINQGLFRSYIWAHLGMSIGYVFRIQREFLSRPLIPIIKY